MARMRKNNDWFSLSCIRVIRAIRGSNCFRCGMNMRRKRDLFGLVLVFLLAGVAGGQMLKNFRYPDYDEKGQLRFEITGDEAQVQSSGLIQIKNLKMTFYEQGKVMMQVSTPQCLFDRVKRSAVSSSDVCVSRKEIELTGRGFAWNAQDGRMKILSNTRVILRNLSAKSVVEGVP